MRQTGRRNKHVLGRIGHRQERRAPSSLRVRIRQMLSVEARACAQIRPSSQKVVHALTRQALSNLENASTRSGISNLRVEFGRSGGSKFCIHNATQTK